MELKDFAVTACDPDRLLILGVRSVGSLLAQRIANAIESASANVRPEVAEIELYGSGDDTLRRLGPSGSRSRTDRPT